MRDRPAIQKGPLLSGIPLYSNCTFSTIDQVGVSNVP